MAIESTELKLRLSGGASNSDPAASIGGAISSADMPSGIFSNVPSADSAAGETYYRLVYVRNTDPALTAEATKVWFSSVGSNADTTFSMGLATEGLNTEVTAVSNEHTAPSPAVTFLTPTTEGTALAMGNIPAGQYYGLWLKLVVAASSSAYSNDGFTVRVRCDTAA